MTTSRPDAGPPTPETTGASTPVTDGAAQHRPGHTVQEPAADPRRWIALCVVLSAAFIDMLDVTIVNVAVPAIQTGLGANYGDVQWLVAGYTLAFGALLITGGRLGDMVGRRRMFMIGTAGFALASLLCGLAQSPEMLIGGRVASGLFAAAMVPQVLAIIHVTFPQSEIGKVIGLYGAIVGLAVVAGPLVGGLLVSADVFGLGWRAVFLINVPIGIAAMVIGYRTISESRSPHPLRADLAGMVLVSLGLGLTIFGLIQGREAGWPAWSLGCIVGGIAVLGVFAAQQRARFRSRGDSLVALSLFGNRGFGPGIAVQLIFNAAVASFFIVWTLFMQHGLGWSPVHAGLTALPYSIAVAVSGGLSMQVFVPRLGRTTLVLGSLVMAAGVLLFALEMIWFGLSVTSLDLVVPLLLIGLGMGGVVAPLINLLIAEVPPQDAGSASGVINTAAQFGGAAGIALIGLVFAPPATGSFDFVGVGATALWFTVGALVLSAVVLLALPRRWAEPQAAPTATT